MQSFPDTCWQLITAESRQSRKFLKRVEGNSLTQLVREPARDGALLDLLFADGEGLVGGVWSGALLGTATTK